MNNVLISSDSPSAHYFIRMGLARAFSYCQNEVAMWDIHKKPVFDMFDEFEPDILFGQTYNLTPALINAIEERPWIKVFMKASDWGPLQDNMDLKKHPVLVANEKEIALLKELKERTGKPDSLYVHYSQDRLNDTHGHWMDAGFKVTSLMNASDVFIYTKGVKKPEYESDAAFIGGRWGYKAKVIDKWLLPLCQKLNVRVFGNSDWGIPSYCGRARLEENRHIFASTKVCPNLHEPHSHEYGYDIVERPFKLTSMKGFVVSDYVEDLDKIYGNTIASCKTSEEFQELILEYCLNYEQHQDEMNERSEEAYKITIAGHTYFDRLANLFRAIDDTYMTEKLEEYKGLVIKELEL